MTMMGSSGSTTSTGLPGQTPLACKGLDNFGAHDFVQDRLAMLGKTIFVISGGFFVVLYLSRVLLGGLPPLAVLLHPLGLAHLAGTLVMGALWWFARGHHMCSLPKLGLLDATTTILTGGFFSILAYGHASELGTTLLAINFVVFSRAVLVPSSPRRTLIISLAALLPTFFFCVFTHAALPSADGEMVTPAFQKLNMTLATALWVAAGAAIATVTSRVIYGLRQQVAEADIGQYTLEERIGSGGMGEIWRARHRMLIRPAAVKLIRRQALGSMPGDPEVMIRRFEREARATAALKSPHTVQLYDFGVTDDGTLYYVMELLDGLDLETLIKRYGPLPAERAIHILRQVCASLADAHGNGLVHRDIKPANIVVSRFGAAFDFVKVLDFGLVKIGSSRHSDGDDQIKLTAAGSTSGTPGYMAPEIALGEEINDHRVDIYSLGCVAYWLITGTMVFEGDTAMKVMIDHARTTPTPPSRRVELPIPAALEQLILECLAKDPERRPASAEVLSARLEACAVASAWTTERAERWWGAHVPATGESARPVADMLVSQEMRPRKLVRQARPRG